MARHVKLLNGKTYPVDRCGADPERLMVRVTSGNLLDLVSIFGKPKNTRIIEHYIDNLTVDHVVYENYTALTAACYQDGGVLLTLNYVPEVKL